MNDAAIIRALRAAPVERRTVPCYGVPLFIGCGCLGRVGAHWYWSERRLAVVVPLMLVMQ